jgi:hypothetical protein
MPLAHSVTSTVLLLTSFPIYNLFYLTQFYCILLGLYNVSLSYTLTPSCLTHPLTKQPSSWPLLPSCLAHYSPFEISYQNSQFGLPSRPEEGGSHFPSKLLHTDRPTPCDYVTKTRSSYRYEKLNYCNPKLYVFMYYIMYVFIYVCIILCIYFDLTLKRYTGWTDRVTGK